MTPLLIGIAFGWALERAGLGNARKLMGQFYLTDLTVFKVMFSAILTAMLGVFWGSYLGWIDLGSVAVPETFVLPQAVGGLIFGAGFALAGLCPGTSCVAAATGRADGLAAAGGLFGGVLLSAFCIAGLEPLYESTPAGPVTLPDLLMVPHGVVVLAIVLLALAGFAASEWLERKARRS